MSFRMALLLSVVAILLATVGVLSVVSYANARAIVDDLAYQALDQTAARVHDRLTGLIDGAAHTGRVQAERLAKRRWTLDDLPDLVQGFHEAISMNPTLSFISVGLETGCYGHVYRTAEGTLLGRIQQRGDGLKPERVDFGFTDGIADTDTKHTPDEYDPRARGWYRSAKAKNAQLWPPVYLFVNKPNPDYPGLTCATPVRGPAGKLQGVTTADFDLIALGKFLAELRVPKGGVAFVVEIGPDGTHRVVAHPHEDTFIGRIEVDGEPKDDILPIDQLPDESVRLLVAEVMAHPANNDLRVADIESSDQAYLGAYTRLESGHDLNWVVALLVPRDALMAPVERSSRRSLLIGIISLLFAGFCAWFLARRIATPLERLAKDTEAIARFELQASSATTSRFAELQRLSGAMEEMKSGLRSFQRYVPADLVREVLESGQEVTLGGERRELSVCFTDIADFTAISENMQPEALVEWLGQYFESVSDAFVETSGTVDKYIGDSVMAFWGAPQPLADRAARACEGALRAAERLALIREDQRARGVPPVFVRFGIGSGELVVGNIGSSRRFNYTVIGDPVNLASRLEALNKMYGTEILIDARTRESAGDAIISRPVELVSVKGRVEGTPIFELLALATEASDEQRAWVALSEAALAKYLARDFAGALAAYEQMLRTKPGDGVAFVMAQGCLGFINNPPDDDWDGVRRMTVK